MMGEILIALLEVERISLRLALVGLVAVQAFTVVSYWRSRQRKEQVLSSVRRTWPRVTVQLPIRNEVDVVERVIRAVSKFDYPLEGLEIQVLDDSDDETVTLVNATVAEVRATGVDIRIVR